MNKMSVCAETYLANHKKSNEKDRKQKSNILDEEKSLIRLVDFQQLSDEESEGNGGETDEENHEEMSLSDDGDDDNDKLDEDQSSKRIRERMERAMAQIGDDSDSSNDDVDEVLQPEESQLKDHGGNNDEEDLLDEAAEELNDGFFDL